MLNMCTTIIIIIIILTKKMHSKLSRLHLSMMEYLRSNTDADERGAVQTPRMRISRSRDTRHAWRAIRPTRPPSAAWVNITQTIAPTSDLTVPDMPGYRDHSKYRLWEGFKDMVWEVQNSSISHIIIKPVEQGPAHQPVSLRHLDDIKCQPIKMRSCL